MSTSPKFLLAILLLLSLNFNAQRHFQPHPLLKKKVGQHFPIENYKDDKGKNFSADELEGKVSLINFWSTTCVPCIEELPYLNKIQETFGTKVHFIAITHDPKEKVDRFLTTHEFNFIHITNSLKELQSYFSPIRNPTTFIIDKKGNVQEITGNIDEEKMNLIIAVLNEYL